MVYDMSNVKNPPDIGCLEAIESLYAWLDGELDDAEMTISLEHHLNHCQSCWSRAEMEKSLTEHIQRSADSEFKNPDNTRSPESLQKRMGELMRKL
jgi:anti-sigma factor (TIGR02949 family)